MACPSSSSRPQATFMRLELLGRWRSEERQSIRHWMIQNGQEQSPEYISHPMSLSEISTTWPGQSTVTDNCRSWFEDRCHVWRLHHFSETNYWLADHGHGLSHCTYIFYCHTLQAAKRKSYARRCGFHWFPNCGQGIFMCLDIVGWRGNARTISIAIWTRYKAIPYWIIQNGQEKKLKAKVES